MATRNWGDVADGRASVCGSAPGSVVVVVGGSVVVVVGGRVVAAGGGGRGRARPAAAGQDGPDDQAAQGGQHHHERDEAPDHAVAPGRCEWIPAMRGQARGGRTRRRLPPAGPVG